MKFLKKGKTLLPLICMMGLFFACSMTVCAGNAPYMELATNSVKVTHDDKTEKVKIKVKNWKGSKAFVLKFDTGDDSVVKVSLDSQSSDSAKLEIKAKGTGNTVVKVWLDGYERNCQYIMVNSVYYQRDSEDDYSIRHYGYMTGTKGEAARIDDYEIENVNGEEKLCVYFTLTDRGYSDNCSSVTFTAKCEEEDGDVAGKPNATATGMVEGGSGYKVYFKIPNKTEVIKLENNDL